MAQSFDSAELSDRVAFVRFRMEKAAAAAGRDPKEVLLCAACKSRTSDLVRLSALLPIDVLGENRAQEMDAHLRADAYLGKPCHFIGHLQTNKAGKVAGKAALIHGVDSLRLLTAIQSAAAAQEVTQDLLFEINIGEEPSKNGAAAEDLWPLLDAAAGMRHVRVRGLMAIPPAHIPAAESQRYFAMMRRLLAQIREHHTENTALDMLSMGMTADFENAILEGATIVRIGTGIYGPRE